MPLQELERSHRDEAKKQRRVQAARFSQLLRQNKADWGIGPSATWRSCIGHFEKHEHYTCLERSDARDAFDELVSELRRDQEQEQQAQRQADGLQENHHGALVQTYRT